MPAQRLPRVTVQPLKAMYLRARRTPGRSREERCSPSDWLVLWRWLLASLWRSFANPAELGKLLRASEIARPPCLGGVRRGVLSSASDDGGSAMFAPPICRRRGRNNAFPFSRLRRRWREPSETSQRERAIKQSAMRE